MKDPSILMGRSFIDEVGYLSVVMLPCVFLIFSGCREPESPDSHRFTLLSADSTGVDFVNQLTESGDLNIIEYLYFNNGGGVSAGDINNDGLVDLYFTGSQVPNHLYLNRGDFRFEDISIKSGVAGHGDWKTGTAMADVNGDGYLDIYVCQVSDYKGLKGGNQLFINNGDLSFSDRTAEYGLDFQGFSSQSVFFDLDLDGDLDMFLLNHSVHSVRSYGESGLREEFDPRAGDRLFRNELSEGRTGYTDITQISGIYSSQIGYGLNVSAGDLNDDGYPDLYVSNDFHENDYAYINNGDGTFSDRFTEMMAHSSRSSMGNDIGDFNNDGLLDVIVLDMLPVQESIRQRSGGEDALDVYQIKRSYGYYHQFVRNTLQLNLGGGIFSEIGRLAGVYATDWSWSPLWCDLDNDGWKDLFITNGIYRRPNDLDYIKFLTMSRDLTRNRNVTPPGDEVLYEKMPLDSLVNFVYRNNRDFTFTDKAVDWGLGVPSFSNGSAYADLDNDGDLELIVNNINQPVFIYRNNSRSGQGGGNYISLKFKGGEFNTFGVGTRVVIYHHDKMQMAENFLTRGFYSSVPPEIHFGLDTASRIDSMDILWPGKRLRRLFDLPVNRQMTLDTSSGIQVDLRVGKAHKMKSSFTKKEGVFPGIKHRENRFVDFNYEKLIPHQLSREGPCITVGDVNMDMRDDIYFGGAADQPGKLLVQQEDGSFISIQESLFMRDRFCEDVDAGFFDADNDGDLDLLVVSGGNEFILPNPFMTDRLYLNDGRGTFRKANTNLPEISHNGACLATADYDGDGDTDIFLGSRSVPRAYGLSPASYLLVNDGKGFFKDETALLAPELTEAGMVTSAVWMDADLDRDEDLVIAGEWMPVTILENEEGRLTKINGRGLDETSGWWFTLKSADIDRDGDQDLIGGNLGLNSYLKATPEFPVRLYINDFDQNGLIDQVITYYSQGKEYPFAPVDELFDQIPALESGYDSYAAFAGTTIGELFPEEVLKKSIVREVDCFASCVFINDGAGSFDTVILPREVQFAPVMDLLTADLNDNGQTEMVIGGNFYPVVPYMGRYDASYGWLVNVLPGPSFRVDWPAKSGFLVRGEIRDMEFFRTGKEREMVIGLNDQEPEVFSIR